MATALLCIALLGFLLFGLGFAVSIARGRAAVPAAIPEDPSSGLYKIYRAHANTAEYAPFFAVLFYILGSANPATWVVWCIGLATLSRYLIAAGILFGATMATPHPLRFVGALGTYVFGAALSVALLMRFLA